MPPTPHSINLLEIPVTNNGQLVAMNTTVKVFLNIVGASSYNYTELSSITRYDLIIDLQGGYSNVLLVMNLGSNRSNESRQLAANANFARASHTDFTKLW
jgi:hypothetical protein